MLVLSYTYLPVYKEGILHFDQQPLSLQMLELVQLTKRSYYKKCAHILRRQDQKPCPVNL